VLWDRCSVGGTATIKEATLAELEVRNPDEADEVRPFVDKGRVDIVNLAGGFVGRGVFEPGWRWSEHVKPIAGTDSCQSSHLAYCISGRMVVRMDDGTEDRIGPGDVVVIPPGHDAWVVGDEPCVQIDFTGMETYARRS
jgi:quercetin dioxygenase-like cupin family protein